MSSRKYVPEGLHTGLPKREELLAAMQEGTILESMAVRCDAAHNLIVALDGMTGIIPREECALGIAGGETKEIAILSRVGKSVCYRVMDMQDGQAILSRRAAQQEALRTMLDTWQVGDVIDARVTHLEPFGAFVDVGCGVVSMIGIENLSVSRISHPNQRVSVGQELKAVIRGMDRRNSRIMLSQRELLGTWEQNARDFHPGETVCGIVRSVEEYGVFVELTPNLSGLAEQRFPVRPGDAVSCYIKSILPERMKIKLNLIDIIAPPAAPVPLRYFITEGHLDTWQYSPTCCESRVIRTEFAEGAERACV